MQVANSKWAWLQAANANKWYMIFYCYFPLDYITTTNDIVNKTATWYT